MQQLKHRVIVVTGAAGRLGQKMVRRFAEEGASIAAVVRTEADARSLPFPKAGTGWAFPVDLIDEELVGACFDRIREQFGRVDALVHTVGMWEGRSFEETSLAQWDRVLRTNLTSTFLCFREAARVMDGPGRLIAFAARQGVLGGEARQAAYSAAKAGLVRLVEAVDAEMDHVTAHAIAPSTILYDEGGTGVQADDLVEITASLLISLADATAGSTIRAFGSG